MRLSSGLLSFLVLAAAALVVSVLLASTAPEKDPCAAAQASIDHGRVTDAQAAYAEVLKDDPAEKCATDGMLRVTDTRCQRADRLRIDGAKAEARKDYIAILAADTAPTDPSVVCAARGLGSIERAQETNAG